MEIKGEYLISSSRAEVWAALTDPEILRACVPGCESLERISETDFSARITAAIGPVRARFDTRINMENVKAPESYTLVGSGKGGAAGFGRGSADVRLVETDDGTQLTYVGDFRVGGKLAQVGSRLVLGATKKTVDDFFGNVSRRLDPAARRVEPAERVRGTLISRAWLAIAAALLALLIWWILLR